jgi:glycosyltransferase involved in cell wall biosynthesis
MRILCLGDSPFLNTGFGVVNRVATDHLISLGHELIVLGGQDQSQRERPGMTFIPTKVGLDMMGISQVRQVVETFRPDAVHIIGDPTSVVLWTLKELDAIRHLPIIAYMPVEGAPFNRMWTRAFKDVPDIQFITCTYYGQKVLKAEGFESRMAYHGVSDDFKPISAERRQAVREGLGWDDRFVVMCVAQNVRRKQWPRLLEAIKMASRRDDRIILYAHTLPFNNNWQGGHDLPMIADFLGVSDRVFFSPDLAQGSHNASIPLGVQDEKPGLLDLYGMADAFVLPTQVEGFGLPLAEAMACGLPVATTGYAAGAEVVDDAGILLTVHDWEWNQAGAKYANVAPATIADAIVKLTNPENAKRYRKAGLERSKIFTWDAYRDALGEMFSGIQARAETTEGVQ